MTVLIGALNSNKLMSYTSSNMVNLQYGRYI